MVATQVKLTPPFLRLILNSSSPRHMHVTHYSLVKIILASGTMSNETNPGTDEGVTFVGWQPEDNDPPRKSAPRAHHKKSRAGCQQCRARRVKVSHPQ